MGRAGLGLVWRKRCDAAMAMPQGKGFGFVSWEGWGGKGRAVCVDGWNWNGAMRDR